MINPIRAIRRGLTARRATGALVATLLAGGVVTLTASPAHAAATTGGGFVWANNSTSASYTPAASYNDNSTEPFAAINTITRSVDGTGPLYAVRFPDLGLTGGTVQVTAYGSGSVACQVQGWGAVGTDQVVYVRCFNNAGTAVNSQFTVAYTNVTEPEDGAMAYVWAHSASSASYTPSLTYQANSSGGTNTIIRSNPGVYTVRLPGLGSFGGHVQVTPYGSAPARCTVAGWGNNAGTQEVAVRCFTMAGTPADSRFTMTYVADTNILGLGNCCDPWGHETAYAWADSPTAASYNPFTLYEFSSFPTAIATATRLGVGEYAITWYYWLDHNYGNVQVTAYSGQGNNCKVAYWNNDDGIRVNCFTAAGAPVDVRYTVAFTGPTELAIP